MYRQATHTKIAQKKDKKGQQSNPSNNKWATKQARQKNKYECQYRDIF